MATAEGVVLAIFFYGGLYLTVTRGLTSKHPALLFIASFILRLSIVIAGFYFFTGGQWQLVISCLAGFTVTGFAVRAISNRSLAAHHESATEQSETNGHPSESKPTTVCDHHAPQS